MDTHTDVPYFLCLQKQDKKKLFFETTIAYACYIKKPVVFQVVFTLYMARLRNCCFKQFVLFCLVVFVSLFVFIFYIFLCCVGFISSITARACYVLFNQSSLVIVTRTVCSLSSV